ncbi:MAG: ferritin family protein [Candidatus Thermoplasmatota archaeon]|nr:ferritin family protein [Candidatus Thermoplasmatota archaeon]
MYSSEEVIELAVNVETNGERFYSESARRAEGDLKKIFEFLAKQEDLHKLKFESLRKYAKDFILPRDWEEIEPYLNVIVESTFFMGNEKSFKRAMGAKDSVEALEFALQFEKDTLLFFNEIVEISGEQSEKVVNEIIGEEKKHIEMISELLREHRV